MGYIHCCGALRECKSFELKTDDTCIIKNLDYLEICPVCGHTVIQLTKVNCKNQISSYRITNKKARKFFEKCKKDILREKETYEKIYIQPHGKFYLNYNEYGKKKKCYSNLSSLKIGLFDNNLNLYKR